VGRKKRNFKKKEEGLLWWSRGLHLRSCNAGSPGSIPGQRTRSLHVIAKTWHSQIKIHIFLKRRKRKKSVEEGKKRHIPKLNLQYKDDSRMNGTGTKILHYRDQPKC